MFMKDIIKHLNCRLRVVLCVKQAVPLRVGCCTLKTFSDGLFLSGT